MLIIAIDGCNGSILSCLLTIRIMASNHIWWLYWCFTVTLVVFVWPQSLQRSCLISWISSPKAPRERLLCGPSRLCCLFCVLWVVDWLKRQTDRQTKQTDRLYVHTTSLRWLTVDDRNVSFTHNRWKTYQHLLVKGYVSKAYTVLADGEKNIFLKTSLSIYTYREI